MKSIIIRFLLYSLFLIPALIFAKRTDADPAFYENKWLVITGNYRTYERAEEINDIDGYNASIILSTYFENLVPGWYTLVLGKYSDKAQALDFSQELSRARGIKSYVKYSGQLFFSDESQYRVVELDDEDYFAMEVITFYHAGGESPDQNKNVFFVDHEQDPEEFPKIEMLNSIHACDNLFVFADEEEISWSPGSDKFAFIGYDALYNGGDQRIYIVDTRTYSHIDFSVHELIEGEDFDNRDKLTVYNLAWLESGNGIIFCMDVDFLGTSGDDMIDQHRIEELGEEFGTRSPVFAGNYIIYLKP